MAHHTWALIGCLNRKCAWPQVLTLIKRQKVVDLAACDDGDGDVDAPTVNGSWKNSKAVSSVSAPLPASRLAAANRRRSFISQAAGVFFTSMAAWLQL